MSRRSVVPGVAAVVLLSCVAAAQDCLEPVASWRYGVCRSVAAEGGRAVLPNGAVLQVIDVSAPSTALITGEITLEHDIAAVAIDGTRAYASSYGDLHVIDIAGPAPTVLGTLTGIGGPHDLAVAAGMVYAIDHESVRIIDATVPSAPVVRGEFVWDEGYPGDIEVSLGYAFVAAGDIGLRVLDVSDPGAPTEVAHLDLGVSTSVRRLDIVGSLAYAVGSDSTEFSTRLWVIDLADPAHPALVSNTAGAGSQDIVVRNGTAFVAGPWDLTSYDVTNPLAPVFLGQVSVPYYPLDGQHHLAAADGLVLMAAELFGLGIYDVDDPAAPVRSDEVGAPGVVEDAEFSDGVVYIAAGDRGFRTVDVTDPTHPSELVETGVAGIPQAWGVEVRGDTAFLASLTSAGLVSLDVADPAVPVVLGNAPGAAGNWIALGGQHAYVVDGWLGGGLSVVAISTPGAPGLVGSLPLGSGWWEWPVVIGDHLIVRNSTYSEGPVVVVDAGDPAAPVQIASFDTWSNYGGLATIGSWLLVPDVVDLEDPAVRIFDMSDPAVPVEVGVYTTVGGVVDAIGVAGSVAYLEVVHQPPFQSGAIEVVNFANPRAPIFMDLVEHPGPVKRFAFGPDELYVFEGGSGFDSYSLCRGPIFADGFESGDTSAWAGGGG